MTTVLLWLLLAVAVAVVFAGLDRLALWMERRGWIYYRRSARRGGTLGNALLEVQSLVEPAARHQVEETRQARREEEPSGDPPETPGGQTEVRSPRGSRRRPGATPPLFPGRPRAARRRP